MQQIILIIHSFNRLWITSLAACHLRYIYLILKAPLVVIHGLQAPLSQRHQAVRSYRGTGTGAST